MLMKVINHHPNEKLVRDVAYEANYLYAALAHRLGLYAIKSELEDMSLKYTDRETYTSIARQLNERKNSRDAYIAAFIGPIKEKLEALGLKFDIKGRTKSIFSIWNKMKKQKVDLPGIYDLFAIRVIIDTPRDREKTDCWKAYAILADMYTANPARMKDWITLPKSNGYESLHTTVSAEGRWVEVQIRTQEMHDIAEYGIAAHWKYKEGKTGESNKNEEAKLSWLRQILEWQRDMSDNKEFLSSIKNDLNLFSDSVYCFTPTGDVKTLPAGSNPIDFAYSIHSAVGNKMVGARVNGKLVNIDYEIKNGDRIEIITSQNSKGPSRDWLSMVKSTQARNKINQWFKQELKEDNIIKGKELVSSYCKGKGIVLSEINKPEFIEKALRKYGYKDWDSIMAAVGHGALKEGQIVNKLNEEYLKTKKAEVTDKQVLDTIVASESKEKDKEKKGKGGIVVKGIHDVAVRFSKCCNPVPGDEIVGFVTRGRGITIHRTDCINILNFPATERARLIEAEWEQPENNSEKYSAEINIYAGNRKGLIVDISRLFTEANIDVRFMNSRVNKKSMATINLGFVVSGKEELNRLIDKLRKIDGVTDIERATG